METTNIVDFSRRDGITDALTDLLRTGAQQLIASAVEAELAGYLAQFSDLRTEAGLFQSTMADQQIDDRNREKSGKQDRQQKFHAQLPRSTPLFNQDWPSVRTFANPSSGRTGRCGSGKPV